MPERIRITQSPDAPDAAQIDRHEHMIVLVAAAAAKGRWPTFPYMDELAERLRRRGSPTAGRPWATLDLANERATRVSVATVDDDADSFSLLTLGRKLAADALTPRPREIALAAPGLDASLAERAVEAVAAALLAASAQMPRYQREPDPSPRLTRIRILGLGRRIDLSRTQAAAEGNDLARYLATMPPNELTPRTYRERVRRLARTEGWQYRFLGRRELQRRGAGAFLAVAQGSDAEAGIVHLRYRPVKGQRNRPVTLVGKGICFDTGGYSLKPTKGMIGMQADMQGSSVALGTLLALARLKVSFPVDCWLALADNHISPQAYKPTDVVRASDGTTIEVIDTDAEGRMVLADTLALASREKPAFILDYATLTGACVVALGDRYSGAFTNRPDLVMPIIAAGRASGERVWPLPSDADYDESLKSEVADVRQCRVGGEADHILAARLLARFVPESIPWVHVDMAAGSHEGGLGHVPTELTGFGVRFALSLLLDQRVTDNKGQVTGKKKKR